MWVVLTPLVPAATTSWVVGSMRLCEAAKALEVLSSTPAFRPSYRQLSESSPVRLLWTLQRFPCDRCVLRAGQGPFHRHPHRLKTKTSGALGFCSVVTSSLDFPCCSHAASWAGPSWTPRCKTYLLV
ncbi:hypothetical protein L209DRAFT_69656 [Thermothelomyces heterothallicus CBS 203.75]